MAGRCARAPLHTPLHAPSLPSVRRTCRVDVWLFGELPAKSVDAQPPAGELRRACWPPTSTRQGTPPSPFSWYLAHAALARSRPSRLQRLCGASALPGSPPALRVLQVCTRATSHSDARHDPTGSADGRGAEVEDGGAISSLEIAPPAEAAPLQELLDQVRVPNPHPHPHPNPPRPLRSKSCSIRCACCLTLTLTLTLCIPIGCACARAARVALVTPAVLLLAYIRSGHRDGNGVLPRAPPIPAPVPPPLAAAAVPAAPPCAPGGRLICRGCGTEQRRSRSSMLPSVRTALTLPSSS